MHLIIKYWQCWSAFCHILTKVDLNYSKSEKLRSLVTSYKTLVYIRQHSKSEYLHFWKGANNNVLKWLFRELKK
jgi:predicted hydrolase (HD superfamily)